MLWLSIVSLRLLMALFFVSRSSTRCCSLLLSVLLRIGDNLADFFRLGKEIAFLITLIARIGEGRLTFDVCCIKHLVKVLISSILNIVLL